LIRFKLTLAYVSAQTQNSQHCPKSQTPLTEEAAAYTREMLFSLQGTNLVPVGTNLRRLESISSPLPDKQGRCWSHEEPVSRKA